MVTMSSYENGVPEYVGLSTDQKPTEGVPNGATFFEMNTGKVYFFNAAGSTWVEVS